MMCDGRYTKQKPFLKTGYFGNACKLSNHFCAQCPFVINGAVSNVAGMSEPRLRTLSFLEALVVIAPDSLPSAPSSRRNDDTVRESSPFSGLRARPAS